MSERRRLLNDLRVIDLRAELEKRNIDKSGVRGVLIQRLSKYIQEEEGEDPATYRFDLPGGGSEPKSSPTKKTRRSESAVETERPEETPAMEDMVVQDEADEEQGEVEQEAEADAEIIQTPSEPERTGTGRKRDMLDDSDASQPKKPCLEEDQDQKNENNTDVDDSINLDLGEDELLNEETDSTSKAKMDEASAEATTQPAGRDDAAGSNAAAAPDLQVNEDNAAATSNDDGNHEKDTGDTVKNTEGEKKKDEKTEGGARNLWVSGLSGDTRAKDLKQLCSKHGKVIGAKVVTNAKTPGSRCYGYITMASPQDAENCLKNLHRSELHGRMISVEKAKSESESVARRQPADTRIADRKDAAKEQENKDGASSDKRNDGAGGENLKSDSRTSEKSNRPEKDRPKRSTRSRERKRSPQRDILSFNKIWQQKERDVARSRERSRALREEERRRRAAEDALRERERRQRLERQRLALEKEKLRAEREKIEREKNALLRLERERHRLEREKLELERLELKRAQLRLEEERRKRAYDTAYRKPAPDPMPEPAYERADRHKRAPPPPMVSTRGGPFEAPPPPRFDMTPGYERGGGADKRDRDYKRDYPRHAPSGNMKYPSNGNSNDDARQPMLPGNRPKEPGRSYESRDSRPYRPSPPGKPEPRGWSGSSRYQDAAPTSKGAGGSEQWSGGVARYGGGGGGGGGGAAYESRYQPAYQPPPPGSTYPDRYAPPAREYRKY